MHTHFGLSSLVGIILIAGGPALAQEIGQTSTLTVPIKPDEIGFYCIYGNRIYSPGAQLCLDVVRPGATSQAALVCKTPTAAGARASWEASGTIICSTPASR
jgi:hypothetical protein